MEAIDAASAAVGVLAVGDVIRTIDGRAVRADGDVRGAIAGRRPGAAGSRSGLTGPAATRVIDHPHGSAGWESALGRDLGLTFGPVRLAVPVHYSIGDVGGSSGGLMMALRIYDGLHAPGCPDARSFAGTGTIALDGASRPIEGTRQKLIAAKRAGARVFFVPRANFGDIAGERELRVIPVDTFGQALRFLIWRRNESLLGRSRDKSATSE